MPEPGKSSIVSKIGEILDIMTQAGRPLTFTELVERTGFVKSSVHRILSVMLGEGLLEYDPASKLYRLGPRLLHWAQTAWRRSDVQDVANREIQDFSERTGLNLALSILDRDAVLYLRTIDAVAVRYAAHAGDRAPLYNTAVGKVFLAFMPDSQREELLASLALDRLTEHTLVTRAALEADLAKVRARGYGLSDREEFLYVVGMGAPVFDSNGRVISGVSVWTTTDHADIARLEGFAPEMLTMTRRISQLLGHSRP